MTRYHRNEWANRCAFRNNVPIPPCLGGKAADVRGDSRVTPPEHRMDGAPERGIAVMLIIMLIVIVLFGLAYADYCLVDNTEHFGICFGKIAEAEAARESGLLADAIEAVPPAVFKEEGAIEGEWAPDSRTSPSGTEETSPSGPEDGTLVYPPPSPAPAWLLLDLEPVLELHEG
jgi:hypothetical protein